MEFWIYALLICTQTQPSFIVMSLCFFLTTQNIKLMLKSQTFSSVPSDLSCWAYEQLENSRTQQVPACLKEQGEKKNWNVENQWQVFFSRYKWVQEKTQIQIHSPFIRPPVGNWTRIALKAAHDRVEGRQRSNTDKTHMNASEFRSLQSSEVKNSVIGRFFHSIWSLNLDFKLSGSVFLSWTLCITFIKCSFYRTRMRYTRKCV